MKRRTAIVIGVPAVFLVLETTCALLTGWSVCWFFAGAFLVQLAYEATER